MGRSNPADHSSATDITSDKADFLKTDEREGVLFNNRDVHRARLLGFCIRRRTPDSEIEVVAKPLRPPAYPHKISS